MGIGETPSSNAVLRDLEHEDGPFVQNFLEDCDDYSQVTYGLPTGAADAQSLYLSGLEHVPEHDKILRGFWRDGQLDAVFDALVGHPEEDTLSVGLLLVRPSCRSMGIGTLLLAELESIALDRGLNRIRVHGHVEENLQAGPFWDRHGFRIHSSTPMTVNATQPRTRLLLHKNLGQHG